MNPDSQLIHQLGRRVLDGLQASLGDARTAALVDFPNHGNSGDSAIWLGERAALRAINVETTYLADRSSFRAVELSRTEPRGPLLLHGGGNLGDLWPAHAIHREMLISSVPGRVVIQLPQTVSRRSVEHLDALNRGAARLERFDVFVRDRRSLEVLSDYRFLNGVLCPDAAFALGALDVVGRPSVDLVWIQRQDHERAFGAPRECPAGLEMEVVDWLASPASSLARRTRASVAVRSRNVAFQTLGSRVPVRLATRFSVAFDGLARSRVSRAVRLLSRGRVVVTDRLHGHILCLLLGIPHVLLDTSEGKVGAFHATFTTDSVLTRRASSSEEALEVAANMVAAG